MGMGNLSTSNRPTMFRNSFHHANQETNLIITTNLRTASSFTQHCALLLRAFRISSLASTSGGSSTMVHPIKCQPDGLLNISCNVSLLFAIRMVATWLFALISLRNKSLRPEIGWRKATCIGVAGNRSNFRWKGKRLKHFSGFSHAFMSTQTKGKFDFMIISWLRNGWKRPKAHDQIVLFTQNTREHFIS